MKLRSKISWYLSDSQYDRLDDGSGKWNDFQWAWRSRLEDVGQKVLCFIAGHSPVRDQCGMPKHDFCVWCRKSMPGRAKK